MKTFSAAAFLAIALAAASMAQDGAPDRPQNSKRAKAGPSPEQVLKDAAALTATMKLSCAVAEAKLLADGTASIDGRNVHVRSYETACSNGVGYFLVDQEGQAPYGFSCFAAESTRAADIAAGREPQPACTLPANADVKKAAAIVLGKLGQQCTATALRHIGRDTNANTELNEVACSGGTGFVMASPLPGATQPVSALSCPDSYKRGVACKLSSNGAPLITMDTFKQALAQHGVACTVANSRLIGRQNASKRHVVEFLCREKPEGLVAFIPLEDAAAPFETMSCSDAGFKAHVVCTLAQTPIAIP